MTRILIGTAAMLICGAASVNGNPLWLVGVAVGFVIVCKGVKKLKSQND